MKKLLLIAVLASAVSINIDAGQKLKKAWAYYKIAHGISMIPAALLTSAGGVFSVVAARTAGAKDETSGLLALLGMHNIMTGPAVFVPFSVLCIKSGLRDLRKLKKNDVHIQI